MPQRTPRLHEVLAIEKGLLNTSKRLILESIKTFGKENLFKGFVKKKEMFDSNAENALETTYADEHVKLETTVAENLEYSLKEVARYWDAVLSKDLSNMEAKADIIIDSITIASDVPATFLLGLESKLNELTALFTAMPTLEVGREWVKDESMGPNIYIDKHQREAFTTRNEIEYISIAAATPSHKEQIAERKTVKNVGKVTQTSWSGMISSAEKAVRLKRLVKMTNAVKKARQVANSQPLISREIGKNILDYITETD